MCRYCIIFLLVIGTYSHALGQTVSFIAAPATNRIGIKDKLQITYTISNATNLSDFKPNFGDFVAVQGPFQQNSFSINNGVQSSSISLTYLIQPKHEGNITIPPAVAKDGAGHNYQSNSVYMQVVPGSLAPQQNQQAKQAQDPFDNIDAMMQQMMQRGQQMRQQVQQMQQQAAAEVPAKINNDEIKKDFFLKITLDKTKVHVGEQVTATYKLYRLYQRVGFAVKGWKLPTLTGFWTQDLDAPRQASGDIEVVDGRKYEVLTIRKTALFPQQAGNLEVDPSELQTAVRAVQQNRIVEGEADIKSPTVHIQVTPLPDKDKPADYGGAVGRFTITDKIDKHEITTDDVATVTINISGTGNIKLIETPKLDLPNGIGTYDPQITDTVTGHVTAVSGSKIITYAITPHTPGDYEIPALTFSYFNPQTGEYVTQRTEPLKLHVSQGKNYVPAVAGTGNITDAHAARLPGDIHDIIKQPLGGLNYESKPWPLTAAYWSLYSVPLLAFIGIIGWRKRDEELSKDTVRLRNKRANKIALQRLVTAKQLLQQQNKTPFYEEVSKAIWLYLSDKMNIPLSALSRDAARESMSERKVPEQIQKKLEDVIWECETALYASGGSKEMAHTYEEAIKVISDLEDTFKA